MLIILCRTSSHWSIWNSSESSSFIFRMLTWCRLFLDNQLSLEVVYWRRSSEATSVRFRLTLAVRRFSVPTIVEENLILQGLESSEAQGSSTSIDMTHGVHGGVLDCRDPIWPAAEYVDVLPETANWTSRDTQQKATQKVVQPVTKPCPVALQLYYPLVHQTHVNPNAITTCVSELDTFPCPQKVTMLT